jgi:hypothetical protein
VKTAAILTIVCLLGSLTTHAEERRQGVPGDREERRQGVPGDREERRQGVPGEREQVSPDYARLRRALQREKPALVIPVMAPALRANAQDQPPSQPRSDSVWEGLLIGAAIGGAGGYVWARNICGSDDTECFVITAPVGILGGAGIGALVGAVADKLHK